MNTIQFNKLNNITKVGGISRGFLRNPKLTAAQVNTLINSLHEFNDGIRLEMSAIYRIQELQDKAVIEGLTDKEKKEYKELREL